MTQPLTLTKLIILYMLDQVTFPLKKSQLFDFILYEKEYTNYFTLMQAEAELTNTGLVISNSTHSTTYISITDAGRETLKAFSSKMSEGIRQDISEYFIKNKIQIHNEVSVISNYYKTPNGDYVADLVARENSSDLVNVKLYMPTEEAAEALCTSWKNKSQEIYAYLLENLLH